MCQIVCCQQNIQISQNHIRKTESLMPCEKLWQKYKSCNL